MKEVLEQALKAQERDLCDHCLGRLFAHVGTGTTNLKRGERVRLIGDKMEAIHEVLEVAPGKFRTGFVTNADAVFVFGREVKDFRMVDYEAIAMLNVSATQELKRRLEQQTAEIAVLRQQMAELRGALMAKLAN